MLQQETDLIAAPMAPGYVRLGPYQILRQLGEGGMGAVYEAVHEVIGRRVAIKTLGRAYSAVPGAAVRFLREAQVTSRLRHPHIVDVTDLGYENGICFLVMEYLDGEDLDTRLGGGRLSVDETVEIALPVISAVATAHDHGIIHRDIKPHNIFLTRSAAGSTHPKVLDFGISKSLGAGTGSISITGGSGFLGTPCYLAPEQLEQARGATLATDQYALGVLLYECLTGRTPFAGDDLSEIFHNILTGTFTPPGRVRPDIPAGIQQIITRAMSLRPDDRFGSVRDLGRALLMFASEKTRLNWEPAFFQRPPRPRWVNRAMRPLVLHHPRVWSPWVGLAVAMLTAIATTAAGIAVLPGPEAPQAAPAAVSARAALR